jgi:hypothetical protein
MQSRLGFPCIPFPRLLTLVLILRDTNRYRRATSFDGKAEYGNLRFISDRERMVRAGEIPLSELESLLNSLEEQDLISCAEHESLLKLASKINTDNPSPA